MKTLVAVAMAGLFFASAGITLGEDLSFRADRKVSGQYYLPHSAQAYQRSAINHAQVLEYYGKTNTTVSKEVAQQHATEIRHNLDLTVKEMAKLEPEIKNDSEAKTLVAQIKAHHVKAAEACGMLDAECLKHEANGVILAGCCADMAKELKAADAVHDKLMKHLKVPVAEHAKK